MLLRHHAPSYILSRKKHFSFHFLYDIGDNFKHRVELSRCCWDNFFFHLLIFFHRRQHMAMITSIDYKMECNWLNNRFSIIYYDHVVARFVSYSDSILHAKNV